MKRNQTNVTIKWLSKLRLIILMLVFLNTAKAQFGGGSVYVVGNQITADTCNKATGSFSVVSGAGSSMYSNLSVTNQDGVAIQPSLNDPNLFENLPAGIYNISPTPVDFSDLAMNSTVTIDLVDPLQSGSSINLPTCTTNGNITLNPSNGTAPYTFLWNNAATSSTILLPVGVYNRNVRIMDVTGCILNEQFTINVPSTVNLNPQVIQPTCSVNGSIVLNATGSAPFTYLWNNNASTPTVNLVAGSYTMSVVVTGNDGCTKTESFNIQTNQNPNVVINGCGNYIYNGINYSQTSIVTENFSQSGCIENRTTHINIFQNNVHQLSSSNNVFNCVDSSLLTISGNNDNHIQNINWFKNGVSIANVPQNNLVTVAGENGVGNALNQLGSHPRNVVFDNAGYMYVADFSNSRVLKYPPNSTSATYGVVVAGGNGAGNALNQLTWPTGLFIKGNILYVADQQNGRVMKYPTNPPNNNGLGVIAVKDGLDFFSSKDVFVNANDEIYVSELHSHRVVKYPANSNEFTPGLVVAGSTAGHLTTNTSVVATSGSALNQLDGAQGIWVKPNGDLYVVEFYNLRVTKWAPGATSGIIVAGGNGWGNALNQLSGPSDILFDANDNMYVTAASIGRVLYYPPNATFGTIVADGLPVINGIAFNNDGELHMSVSGNSRVIKIQKKLTKWVYETGTYTAEVTMDNGCVYNVGSINITSQVVVTRDTINITNNNCVSVTYNNQTYYSNSTLYDTIKTLVGACDSIYRVIYLTVKQPTSSTTNTSICASALPYSWNGNSYNAAGTYTVTLTNAAGCDSAATLNLTVRPVAVSQTINLSGCNSVLYNSIIYNTSTTLNEILQNIHGCDSVYKTVNITVNANPVLQIQIPIDSCATTATTISTSVSYNTYSWALPNGSILNTASIIGSQAGNYQLTVTNAQGCSATASFALHNCIPPSIIITGDSILCGGEGTSEITASIAGYPTATFEWTDPFGGTSTSNPIVVNNGSEGLYTLVATLPNGSTITKTINISSATPITYSVSGQNLCSGATVGSFDVTTTGGTAPYTYSWTNSTTSATNTNEDQLNVPYNQDFYGTITDANGCSTVANMYFQVHSPVAVFVNGTTLPCGATSGNVTISATGGLPFYDAIGNPYYIGTGIQNLSVGTYTIYVKDSIGCETAATFTITAPCVCSIPRVSISSDFSQTGIGGGKVYYCYGAALTLTGSLINSATYSWTGPNGFTATTRTIQINPAKPINSGRYTVTASLSATCFSTGYVDVVVLPQIVVTTSSSISVCPNTPVTLSATASTTPVTFYWTYNFATVNPTTFIATNANQGVYLVKAVDAYRCSGINTLKVNLLPVPTPVITSPTRVCVGSTVQLSATPTGGVWTSLNNRASININTGLLTGLAGGGVASIRYTVTNASGCTAFTNYNVTVNSLPSVPNIGYALGTPNPQTGPGGAFCTNKTFTVVGSPTGGVWSRTGVISVTTPAGVVNTGNIAGTGTLTYTFTNANGCSNSRTINGNVATCVLRGVNGGNNVQLTMDNGNWTIYPNPARSVISLNVNSLIGAGSIVVTDLYGKQVKVQSLSMGTNTIDVSSFAKGMYFVSTITSEGKTTKKLVVE